MEKGIIIWLNGVSSSGKSTLVKTLQDRLSVPFYVLANDIFTSDMKNVGLKYMRSEREK